MMRGFWWLLILFVFLGCIQITPPPPPAGGAIHGKMGIYVLGPKRVKIGETFELRVQVTNNFSATLKNVRVFLYTPDIPVSLLPQRIELGDLVSGSGNEGFVKCTLGPRASSNIEYKIYGRVCFDREVEGYHEVLIARDPTTTDVKPRSRLDEEIISIGFVGIENALPPITIINFTIKLKNELGGEITSREVDDAPDSVIRELEIRVPMDDIVASIYAFQRSGEVSDGYLRRRLTHQNQGEKLLLQLKESKEIRVYLTLREGSLEMLKTVDFISFPVYLGLNYTYCVDAPVFSFTSYGG